MEFFESDSCKWYESNTITQSIISAFSENRSYFLLRHHVRKLRLRPAATIRTQLNPIKEYRSADIHVIAFTSTTDDEIDMEKSVRPRAVRPTVCNNKFREFLCNQYIYQGPKLVPFLRFITFRTKEKLLWFTISKSNYLLFVPRNYICDRIWPNSHESPSFLSIARTNFTRIISANGHKRMIDT